MTLGPSRSCRFPVDLIALGYYYRLLRIRLLIMIEIGACQQLPAVNAWIHKIGYFPAIIESHRPQLPT
jgi:hypothetical protein